MRGFLRLNGNCWTVKYHIHYENEYRLTQFEIPLDEDDSQSLNEYVKNFDDIETLLHNSPEIDFEVQDLENGNKVAKLNSSFTFNNYGQEEKEEA